MSAFQTILTDRILSYTPGGHIEVDSPVTFTQPVNIPGGVSDQTINVDTINPFTANGPVTVTTNLIVTSGHKLETNEISTTSGSNIVVDNNLVINPAFSLDTNTISPSSGSTINVGGNLDLGLNLLETDFIYPSTGSTTTVNSNLVMGSGAALTANLVNGGGTNIAVSDNVVIASGKALDTNTINPSTGSIVTVGGILMTANNTDYFSASIGGSGPAVKGVVVFEASSGQGVTTYNGLYSGPSIMGINMNANNNTNFTMSTGASTTYLGLTILGNGGVRYFPVNVTPGNPPSGHVVYSDGDFLYAKDSGNVVTELTAKYIEIYASSNAPTTTIMSTPVSVQAATWSTTILQGFNNNSTTNNLIRYSGPDATNVKISVTMTLSSTTNAVAASLGFYKNPVLSGSTITGGTILEASTAVSFDNANSFYPLSTQMLATLNSGDIITLYINATAIAAITADTCNIIIETL